MRSELEKPSTRQCAGVASTQLPCKQDPPHPPAKARQTEWGATACGKVWQVMMHPGGCVHDLNNEMIVSRPDGIEERVGYKKYTGTGAIYVNSG